MAKTRKNRTRGGKFLRQGSYGCAFRPALACKQNTRNRPRQISKLMEGDDALQEMKQRDLFHGIDPAQKYFLYPFEICDPKLPFRANNDLKKCTVPMKIRKILQSIDGGESIDDIQLTANEYPAFFTSITNLFEGLEKAHRHNIVHNDIKPDNIVITQNTNGTFTTRFIDFGISFRSDDLDRISRNTKSPFARNKNGYSVFDTQYHYWSIEVAFANPHPHTNKKKMIHDFYKETIEGDKKIPYRIFYKKTPQGEKAVITEEYLDWLETTLGGMSSTEKYTYVFTKGDVYSFGRTLAEIFYKRFGQRDEGMSAPRIHIDHNPLHLTQEKQLEVAKTISKPFFKLIRRMVSPDIRTRLNIVQASKIYEHEILSAIQTFFKHTVRE